MGLSKKFQLPGAGVEVRFYLVSFAFAAILIGIYFVLAVIHDFDVDEIEHMHATWYVVNGYVPYRDFFEHHNPLLWFLLAPFLQITGEGVTFMNFARLVSALNAVVMLVFTLKIFQLAVGGKGRLLAPLLVCLVLCPYFFFSTALEVRPDGFMLSCVLISFYYLFKYAETRAGAHIMASGFAFGLAFLFLQKSVLFIPAYMAAYLYLLFTRKISFGRVLSAVVACLVPIAILLVYQLANNSFTDYWVCNFSFNAMQTTIPDGSLAVLKWLRSYDLVLLGVALAASLWNMLRMVRRRELSLVGLICVLAPWSYFAIVLLTVPNPYRQYMEPLSPFAAVIICIAVQAILDCEQAKRLKYLCAVLLIVDVMNVLNVARELKDLNFTQKAAVEYVLRQTEPGDYVHDGSNRFNIFRKDVHYFWFFLHGISQFNTAAAKSVSYDINELIVLKKPKIISTQNIDEIDEYMRDYEATPFARILRRK